jgi:MFS family permease
MLSRAIPAVIAGPFAGVLLDRFDRKRIMIASDLVRAVVALAFVLTIRYPQPWLLYVLSALLMLASPFFTSGRAAILPSITSKEELHTANSLTQTTQWATITAGTILGGYATSGLGFEWAFVLNALSFVASAVAIALLRGNFRAVRRPETAAAVRPWQEYREGLEYIRSVPLILGISLLHVGWAAGGGAAQVLFALFGEQVFRRGAEGIGTIWGFAGIGLLIGGAIGHAAGRRVDFAGYRRVVSASYFVHGATYVAFSLMEHYWAALVFIAASRVGMAVCSVLNYSQLLKHTPDEFRGRVFSTMESLRWGTMMISMAAAGVASEYYSPRAIGVVAGLLGSLTAVLWAWASWTGKIPEPAEALPPKHLVG